MSDYTSVDIYNSYQENLEDPLPKDLWQDLCVEFNTRVMEEVIYKGREFNMGERLSTISVIKVDRDYSKPRVNWKASNELKQEIIDNGGTPYSKENPNGEKWFVYYTDKWYCRFNWHKAKCVVPNKTAYRFTATRGSKGNKTKLKEFLRENDLAHLKYRHLD